MKKLTILVDMDDTIEHLLDAWVKWLNAEYGRTVRADEITDWDITVPYPGLTTEQVYAPLRVGAFWETVRPVEGAAEVLAQLKNEGHTVYIVTAADYETIREKMDDVLFRYFPFFRWDDVIITKHKQLLRADVLIDDGIHNHIGGSYRKLLVTRRYNESFDAEANGMIRVNNWEEIGEAVRRIASETEKVDL